MSGKANTNIDIDSLEIRDLIDIDLLQTFQDNFAESMNIASVTVDKNGIPVTRTSCYTSFCTDFIHSTAIGDHRCAESHKKGGEEAARTGKPFIYECHAGLIDFAAPILVDGKQIGTILGGQILTGKPLESRYIKTAREIGVNEEELIESLRKIKIVEEKNVKAAAEVLYIIANALSEIGYEGLKLKSVSENLEMEVLNKNQLLEECKIYSRLKTKLFTTISHELKTPVNIIFSALQLLDATYNKDNSLKDTIETFLRYSKVMKQNCYRMIRLIDNLIDLNKIELGFYNLNAKNKDIIKTIEDVVSSVAEYANLKDINLVFDTNLEEKIIAFDEEKVERIMLNLLSNSIKFTESGGNINVSIYGEDNHTFISVKDTGIVIPDDMIDKIFDTFTQVDDSLRRNVEGSGIGLSLVRSLIQLHEGEIIVKSKLGIGSEFIIKLPDKFVEDEPCRISYDYSIAKDNIEKIKIEFSDIYL